MASGSRLSGQRLVALCKMCFASYRGHEVVSELHVLVYCHSKIYVSFNAWLAGELLDSILYALLFLESCFQISLG